MDDPINPSDRPATPPATAALPQKEQSSVGEGDLLVRKLESLQKQIEDLNQQLKLFEAAPTPGQSLSSRIEKISDLFQTSHDPRRKILIKVKSLYEEQLETSEELLALHGCTFIPEADGTSLNNKETNASSPPLHETSKPSYAGSFGEQQKEHMERFFRNFV